jgi:single-strand DNA-binding protein
MLEQPISVSGLVATTPRHIVTQDGLEITSFRLASTVKVWDETTKSLKDGETNWLTITAYKRLAVNTATSVSKGDRVIVIGSLRVRDWDNGERAGTSVEIKADTIGHDLTYGEAVFTRTTPPAD